MAGQTQSARKDFPLAGQKPLANGDNPMDGAPFNEARVERV
jgi:hypothetical protein